ncbi:MAG: flagellar motor switch phosphatase FliY [Alicyclobacillus sp.]|nr:flagellar motor switch phosphatase FliY [Alicyclobacillus sp.]
MRPDEKLSQAEIEALLQAREQMEVGDVPAPLSEVERDTIGEIGNISFGTAATTLSNLLRHRVEITTPEVRVMRVDEVQADFPQPYVIVTVQYTSGLSGINALAIEIKDAKTIADLMMGGDGTHVAPELNELHLSAVAEAMNQMMGASATAMSAMFNRQIHISPPVVRFVDLANGEAPDIDGSEWVVNCAFRLRVGQLLDSRIMHWLPVPFAKDLLQLANEAVGNQATVETGDRTPFPTPGLTATRDGFSGMGPVHPDAMVGKSRLDAPAAASAASWSAAEVAAARQASAPVAPPASARSLERSAVTLGRPEFQDFGEVSLQPMQPRNLSLLFDVQLNVTVELGRTKRPIREILEMAPGSILELDKLAGEPVDIYVNQKRIAVGEVVVIDENFGVRVTDILSPAERVQSFRT